MLWAVSRLLVIVGCLWLVVAPAAAQRARERAGKPAPTHAEVRYGPHERNVLDLWQADGEGPRPLVVFFHGGGFRGGDRSAVWPELLRGCLERGISVASANYRLSHHAPFPAPMRDGARAVQFLRQHREDYRLDPDRIGAAGGSAGAGIALWIGFHDDLADPTSEDPVAREATRFACMGVMGAQSSYDPRFIEMHIGGRAVEHPALLSFYGISREEMDTPKAYALYEQASPINYVSAGDPPVFMVYSESRDPLPEDARPGRGIHHPRFGELLKAKMDPLGIPCTLAHLDDYRDEGNPRAASFRDMVAFFAERLGEPDTRRNTGP
jgi:acetyl esterase/lipase